MSRYKTDDLVFAKVKGHSPWPATVINREPRSKYKVFFYGTSQEAIVKEECIWNYKENKIKFASKYKTKQYKNALEIIEKMETRENNDLENMEEDDEQNGRFEKNPFYNVDEVGEHRRQGVNEVGESRQQGVDDVREHRGQIKKRQQGVEVGEHRQQGVEVGEHRQQGVEVGEYRQQGVDGQPQLGVDGQPQLGVGGQPQLGVDEQRQQGVGEVGEHRRHGVGQVANVPRASLNSRADDKIKVKIQVELEMSEDQLISVGQRLPGFLIAANVQM